MPHISIAMHHHTSSHNKHFVRFGEEPLHSCEIMLHDIDSSKRLNTAITALMNTDRASAMEDEAADDVSLICVIGD
jgi:hypothetical protein